MIMLILLACANTNNSDTGTSAPYCSEVTDDGTAITCNKTGQPAYSCAGNNDKCWYDAGGTDLFHYDCNRPADRDDAQQQLFDFCGGFSPA